MNPDMVTCLDFRKYIGLAYSQKGTKESLNNTEL